MATKLTLSGGINWSKVDIDDLLAAKVIALVSQQTQNGESSNSVEAFVSPEMIKSQTTSNGLLFAGKGLMEAFEDTQATSNPERISVAGQRAMEESETDSFSSKDISEQFKSAGISSKNLARDMANAVRQSLIYKVTGQKNTYKLTERALKGFKEGFSQIKRSGLNRSGRKSKTGGVMNKLEISQVVKDLQIEATMDGFVDYHKLTTKGDRIIWLLIFAANKQIESLNSKEIEYLAQLVSDQMDKSSVPALTETAVKKGFIAKSGNKLRALHRGEAYLKGKLGDKA